VNKPIIINNKHRIIKSNGKNGKAISVTGHEGP
jgi:hypothetical protein